MGEIPHYELEKYHYQALKNPMYRMEYMFDILREELMMNLPYLKEERPDESLPEPEWTKKQWGYVQQIKSEVVGWRQKHAELQLAIDKLQPKRKKPKYD